MAERTDLTIGQNSKFEYTINVLFDGQIVDISGWTARMQIRANRQDDAELLEDCDAFLAILGPVAQIQVDIPGDVTAEWGWDKGAYDINIYDDVDGEPYNIAWGNVVVRHNVIV